MTRAFAPDPVDSVVIDGLVELARQAPTAGNTDALDLLVLTGTEQVAAYWDLTLAKPRRSSFRWPALLDAPVLMIVIVRPDAYVERYAEADKQTAGLGEQASAWSVPYWWVDGGMAAMTVLLGAADHGLGGLFFGLFEYERAVLDRFDVPADRRAVGTIALGRPLPHAPGGSAGRPRRPLDEMIHRGTW